jgi:hypothetical protein
VLTDKQLSATRPDDEVGLSLKARRGELAVLAMRIAGPTLVNVTFSYKGLNGLVILPGAWFQYTPAGPAAGTLKLARREFEGHSYAVDLQFAAGTYNGPRPPAAPTATTSTTDRVPR